MIGNKYLIRLDDACPTMEKGKWDRMETLLDKYGIKPMIGIVPDCQDESLMIQDPDPAFWGKARAWQTKGYAIALHGFDHVYASNKGLSGVNPMWERSEFAGVPLDEQKKKIRNGIKILKDNGLSCEYFFAPSHTFDDNTLIALKEESDIRIISDTIALRPYLYKGFAMIPQIVSIARVLPLCGVYTFCYHPNSMIDSDFEGLETFISNNQKGFIAFQSINTDGLVGSTWFDRMLKTAYFFYHRIRNPK